MNRPDPWEPGEFNAHQLRTRIRELEAALALERRARLENRSPVALAMELGSTSGRSEACIHELEAARAATFFCQNAGYMCERCGKHKYKHEGGDLRCPPQPSGGSEHG